MGREFEVKLLVEGFTWDDLRVEVSRFLEDRSIRTEAGSYIDGYWPSVLNDEDFVRLRISRDVQLTFKSNDKGSIEDRREDTLFIDKNQLPVIETMLANLTKVEPVSIAWQFMDIEIRGAEIAVIRNMEDATRHFVEVEVKSKPDLPILVGELSKHLGLVGGHARQVKNSFYDIYVKKRGVHL